MPSPLWLLGGAVVCAWWALVLARWTVEDRDAWRDKANHWFVRCVRAEGRVNELFMEHQEDRARRSAVSWEIISERARLIDEAKAKCGEDFPHVVGTAQDPVFLSRPDADLDDIAFVATIDELVGATVEEGDQ